MILRLQRERRREAVRRRPQREQRFVRPALRPRHRADGRAVQGRRPRVRGVLVHRRVGRRDHRQVHGFGRVRHLHPEARGRGVAVRVGRPHHRLVDVVVVRVVRHLEVARRQGHHARRRDDREGLRIRAGGVQAPRHRPDRTAHRGRRRGPDRILRHRGVRVARDRQRRLLLHVPDRHPVPALRANLAAAVAARHGDGHLVGVGVARRPATRGLEVGRVLEAQHAAVGDLEQGVVPAAEREAGQVVAGVRVLRLHRAGPRAVLVDLERRWPEEGRRGVGRGHARARIRPPADALVVDGPHLHLPGGVRRQAADGQARAGRVARPARPARGGDPGPDRPGPVPDLVARDRRPVVVRGGPAHDQAGRGRASGGGGRRRARRLRVHVAHRHRVVPRRGPGARALPARHGDRQLVGVGVVGRAATRGLEVGRIDEGERPGGGDGEERPVRSAHAVAGHGVGGGRVRIRRGHRAHVRPVLVHLERRVAREGRRGVGAGGDRPGGRPAAGAGGVGFGVERLHLHLVGRAGRQPRQRQGTRRGGEVALPREAAVLRAVAHVVGLDRWAGVGRLEPVDDGHFLRRLAEGRGDRGVRRLLLVRHRHGPGPHRAERAVALAAGGGDRQRVGVGVRGAHGGAARALEVGRAQEAQRARVRDIEQARVRAGQLISHVVARVLVRRGHRRHVRAVLRHRERGARSGNPGPEGRGGVVNGGHHGERAVPAIAFGVPRPHPHLVRRPRREPGERRRRGGAPVVHGHARGRRAVLLVVHVVGRDRRSGVRRGIPRDFEAGPGRPHEGRRRRAAGHLVVHVRHPHRVVPRRGQPVRAAGGGDRHRVVVGVVRGATEWRLEVGRDQEGERAVGPDREQVRVRAAERVAGDRVARVRVRRLHDACVRSVLRHLEGLRTLEGRGLGRVRHRHDELPLHAQRTGAVPACRGDRHLVGVRIVRRAALRVLEVRRALEEQRVRPALVPELEEVRVRPGERVAGHRVAHVRIRGDHRAHPPHVLLHVDRQAPGAGQREAWRAVDDGRRRRRLRPRARALVALRPHLHLVPRPRREARKRRAQADHVLRPGEEAPGRARLAVLQVVALDRRPGVGRGGPVHDDAGRRRGAEGRRRRRRRRFRRVGHGDRVVPLRHQRARLAPAGGGDRQRVGVGVRGARGGAARALEVGRDQEAQRARVRDLEQARVRPAERVAGHPVCRVRVGRLHRARLDDVLRHDERRPAGEDRGNVGVEHAGGGPCAGALVVLRAHLHLPGRVREELRERCRQGRARRRVFELLPGAAGAVHPPAHVVVLDRGSRVGRRRPRDLEAGPAHRRHRRRRGRVRRLVVRVRHRHPVGAVDGRGVERVRALDADRHLVDVGVRRAFRHAPRALEVGRALEGKRPVRRDLEQRLVRPALHLEGHPLAGVRVRRLHRACIRAVLRHLELFGTRELRRLVHVPHDHLDLRRRGQPARAGPASDLDDDDVHVVADRVAADVARVLEVGRALEEQRVRPVHVLELEEIRVRPAEPVGHAVLRVRVCGRNPSHAPQVLVDGREPVGQDRRLVRGRDGGERPVRPLALPLVAPLPREIPLSVVHPHPHLVGGVRLERGVLGIHDDRSRGPALALRDGGHVGHVRPAVLDIVVPHRRAARPVRRPPLEFEARRGRPHQGRRRRPVRPLDHVRHRHRVVPRRARHARAGPARRGDRQCVDVGVRLAHRHAPRALEVGRVDEAQHAGVRDLEQPRVRAAEREPGQALARVLVLRRHRAGRPAVLRRLERRIAREDRRLGLVDNRHGGVRGDGHRPLADAARGRDGHPAGVGTAARAAPRVLEIRRVAEGQPDRDAVRLGLEQALVRAAQRVAHRVAGVRVGRDHRDHPPDVLRQGGGEARRDLADDEGGRAVAGGGGGGGRRPRARALVVLRPHLHLVRGFRHEARDLRARRRHVLRAGGPGGARPRLTVAEVVPLDRRPGVRRRRPLGGQRGRARRERRRRRGGRRLAGVRHRHAVVARRVLPARAVPAGGGDRHLVGVRVVRRPAKRGLEVGRAQEVQDVRPVLVAHLEEGSVRPAGRVPGDGVRGVRVRRRHRAGPRHVLRHDEGRGTGEDRRGVSAGRRPRRRRPGAFALVAPRPHPHLVFRVRRKARQGRARVRHVLRSVEEAPDVPLAVLEVVALDRRAARVVARLPENLQAGVRRRPEGRRGRGGGPLVHVGHPHPHVLGHGPRAQAVPAGGGDRHLVGVGIAVRPALRVLEVEGLEVLQPDLPAGNVDEPEPGLVRAGQVPGHHSARVRVRRHDRARQGLVLLHAERVRAGERRRLVHVGDRHRDVRAHREPPPAVAARGGDRHRVGVGVRRAPLDAARALEVGRVREDQPRLPACLGDLEDVRVRAGQFPGHGVARVRVRRRHVRHLRRVLRQLDAVARRDVETEGRRFVRHSARGRQRRPRPLAVQVARPHLHFICNTGRKPREGGRRAGAVMVRVGEGPDGPRLTMLHVVVRDRRPGIVRRGPLDLQRGRGPHPEGRRRRGARALVAHVRHPHRVIALRAPRAQPFPARGGHRQLVDVGVVVRAALRVLEVGCVHEGERAVPRNLEEIRVHAAQGVAGHAVGRVRVRRPHRARAGDVLGHDERRAAEERGRRVRPGFHLEPRVVAEGVRPEVRVRIVSVRVPDRGAPRQPEGVRGDRHPVRVVVPRLHGVGEHRPVRAVRADEGRRPLDGADGECQGRGAGHRHRLVETDLDGDRLAQHERAAVRGGPDRDPAHRRRRRRGPPDPGGGPVALALVAPRQHLHLVSGVRQQARDARRRARACVRRVDERRAAAGQAVAQVVVRDRGSRVRRRLPLHDQLPRAPRRDARRGWGGGRLRLVRHPHGDGRGRGQRARADPAGGGDSHLVAVGVGGALRTAARALEVGRALEGKRAVRRDVEPDRVRTAQFVGHRVARVRVARRHRARRCRAVLGEVEDDRRARAVEDGRGVGGGGRGGGRRPGARALVVARAHLHLVGRPGCQAREGRGRARAVMAGVGERAAADGAVLHVVVVDRRAGVLRRGPADGEGGAGPRPEGRRRGGGGRLQRVRHRHLVIAGRGRGAGAAPARGGHRHLVDVGEVVRAAARGLEVGRTPEGKRAVRRDVEEGRVRPAQFVAHRVARIRVRRRRRTRRGDVLLHAERRLRTEKRHRLVRVGHRHGVGALDAQRVGAAPARGGHRQFVDVRARGAARAVEVGRAVEAQRAVVRDHEEVRVRAAEREGHAVARIRIFRHHPARLGDVLGHGERVRTREGRRPVSRRYRHKDLLAINQLARARPAHGVDDKLVHVVPVPVRRVLEIWRGAEAQHSVRGDREQVPVAPTQEIGDGVVLGVGIGCRRGARIADRGFAAPHRNPLRVDVARESWLPVVPASSRSDEGLPTLHRPRPPAIGVPRPDAHAIGLRGGVGGGGQATKQRNTCSRGLVCLDYEIKLDIPDPVFVLQDRRPAGMGRRPPMGRHLRRSHVGEGRPRRGPGDGAGDRGQRLRPGAGAVGVPRPHPDLVGRARRQASDHGRT